MMAHTSNWHKKEVKIFNNNGFLSPTLVHFRLINTKWLEYGTASRHKLAAVISWPPSPNLEIATAQLPKFVAYPSSSLAFFDNIKASSQLSIIVQLYIIISSMHSICFGIIVAYP